MKKLLSPFSFLVLSILLAALLSFLYERGGTTYAVSILASFCVWYYSKNLLVRPNNLLGTGAKVLFFVIYAAIVFSFYGTFFHADGQTLAHIGRITFDAETVIMSMLATSSLGIIFWLGIEKMIPWSERRQELKEYEKLKEKMGPIEEGFMHLD